MKSRKTKKLHARSLVRSNPKDDWKDYKAASYGGGYKPYYDSWWHPYGYYRPYYRDYYYGPQRPITTVEWVIGGAIVLGALAIVAMAPPPKDNYAY